MGATYTRQSSSEIADGAVIEAADINAEFDELLAAFVAASGHTHDGTAAEGGPVAKLLGTSLILGDGTAGTDITVTFDGESSDGVLTWMEDEDLFKFSDAVTVGVDDTGYDVKFFGDTASRYWLWDTSADGVVQRGTLTVGVDDTGHDVKLFGASAGAYGLWDESADLLDLRGATAAGPGHLKLTTGELTVVDADKLGRIDFQAPLESSGTDAILVGASIYAEADDTFAAGVNNTDLVFALGKSETAAEKFRFTADTEIGIGGANYGTDGQVLTSGGAGAACAWEDITAPVTAINNATVNEIVTIGSTTTELDAEANFTYDGNDAALTSSTTVKPILSLTNTNTDANSAVLKFVKDAGEAGAANDIAGTISFYCDDAGQAQTEFARIAGTVIDATAGGEEGGLDFYVAEYDGTLTKGMAMTGLASDGKITVDISTHDGAAGGLKLGGTLVTTTAAELNKIDGGTTATSTTIADADRIVLNDDGTVVQVAVTDLKTYIGSSAITTAGATFSNYNSIGSNVSTTTESAKNFFLAGTITVESGYTWTVDGDGALSVL